MSLARYQRIALDGTVWFLYFPPLLRTYWNEQKIQLSINVYYTQSIKPLYLLSLSLASLFLLFLLHCSLSNMFPGFLAWWFPILFFVWATNSYFTIQLLWYLDFSFFNDFWTYFIIWARIPKRSHTLVGLGIWENRQGSKNSSSALIYYCRGFYS